MVLVPPVLSRVLRSLFWYADGTHVFIKDSTSKSRHDYYWQKQRYSISTKVAVGYNLQYIDIATGFPGNIHDSKVLYCTISESKQICVKMASKVIRVYPNSFSTREKLQQKFIFSKSNVVRVFVILKVRLRGLLTVLVTNRENVSNTIVTCLSFVQLLLD